MPPANRVLCVETETSCWSGHQQTGAPLMASKLNNLRMLQACPVTGYSTFFAEPRLDIAPKLRLAHTWQFPAVIRVWLGSATGREYVQHERLGHLVPFGCSQNERMVWPGISDCRRHYTSVKRPGHPWVIGCSPQGLIHAHEGSCRACPTASPTAWKRWFYRWASSRVKSELSHSQARQQTGCCDTTPV